MNNEQFRSVAEMKALAAEKFIALREECEASMGDYVGTEKSELPCFADYLSLVVELYCWILGCEDMTEEQQIKSSKVIDTIESRFWGWQSKMQEIELTLINLTHSCTGTEQNQGESIQEINF